MKADALDAVVPLDEANDVLATAERWMSEGRELAIATIVAGAGASVGRRMIVDGQGEVFGGFGQGSAEAAARARAGTVIASGEPVLLDIELPDGHARLYVERLG